MQMHASSTVDDVGRVSAAGPVLLESLNVSCDGPLDEAIDAIAAKRDGVVQGSLLEWDRHCTWLRKLCPALWQVVMPNTAPHLAACRPPRVHCA